MLNVLNGYKLFFGEKVTIHFNSNLFPQDKSSHPWGTATPTMASSSGSSNPVVSSNENNSRKRKLDGTTYEDILKVLEFMTNFTAEPDCPDIDKLRIKNIITTIGKAASTATPDEIRNLAAEECYRQLRGIRAVAPAPQPPVPASPVKASPSDRQPSGSENAPWASAPTSAPSQATAVENCESLKNSLTSFYDRFETIKNHLGNIISKAGIGNVTQLHYVLTWEKKPNNPFPLFALRPLCVQSINTYLLTLKENLDIYKGEIIQNGITEHRATVNELHLQLTKIYSKYCESTVSSNGNYKFNNFEQEDQLINEIVQFGRKVSILGQKLLFAKKITCMPKALEHESENEIAAYLDKLPAMLSEVENMAEKMLLNIQSDAKTTQISNHFFINSITENLSEYFEKAKKAANEDETKKRSIYKEYCYRLTLITNILSYMKASIRAIALSHSPDNLNNPMTIQLPAQVKAPAPKMVPSAPYPASVQAPRPPMPNFTPPAGPKPKMRPQPQSTKSEPVQIPRQPMPGNNVPASFPPGTKTITGRPAPMPPKAPLPKLPHGNPHTSQLPVYATLPFPEGRIPSFEKSPEQRKRAFDEDVERYTQVNSRERATI